MTNQHLREGGAENPVDSRLRFSHGKGASSQPADYGGQASLHRASSRNRDVISGDRGRHRGVRADLSASQRGEKQIAHHHESATSAPLPSRPDDSLTQTTLPWQASGRVAVTPSAPPAYCLRNRSNFCYLNSVAVALHFSSGGHPRDFGSLGPALAVLSRLRKLELFTHATWKELLNGWRRPSQPHDVTELMSFIMDPESRQVAGEWQARCLEPGRDIISDRGSTSPFISLNTQDMPTLSEALASWHTQHYRRALSRPPALLAFQLGRFQFNGRRTIKVRTPCDIPLMLELPLSGRSA